MDDEQKEALVKSWALIQALKTQDESPQWVLNYALDQAKELEPLLDNIFTAAEIDPSSQLLWYDMNDADREEGEPGLDERPA